MSRPFSPLWLLSIAASLACYSSQERVHLDAGITDATPLDASRDARTMGARDTGTPPVIDDPPPEPTGEPLRAVQVELGADGAACALDDEGRVWCWGTFSPPEMRPDDRRVPTPVPVQIRPLPRLMQIAPLLNGHCGIDRREQLWCWGDLPRRRRYDMRPLPMPELSPADGFASQRPFEDCVMYRRRSVCLPDSSHRMEEELDAVVWIDIEDFGARCVLFEGEIRCRGEEDRSGVRGDGARDDGRVLLPDPAAALRGAYPSLMALTERGEIFVWGAWNFRELGLPDDPALACAPFNPSHCPTEPHGPLPVPPARALSASLPYCAITMDDALWCWSPTVCTGPGCDVGPRRIDIESVASVYVDTGICAVTHAGGVRCWNVTDRTLLGDGSTGFGDEVRDPTSWVSGFVRE